MKIFVVEYVKNKLEDKKLDVINAGILYVIHVKVINVNYVEKNKLGLIYSPVQVLLPLITKQI